MGIGKRIKPIERSTRADLNLLLVLEIVVEEGSLTRAAVRLGTTQSAVSHNIARLRELSGDPLFARTSRGIVPTRRARMMAADVRRAMEELHATLIAPRVTANAGLERRRFLLHVPGGLECALLPAIRSALKPGEGPDFRVLNSRSANPRTERDPEEAWLGLDYEAITSDGFTSQHCVDWKPMIISRKGNPLVGKRLTRAALDNAEYVALVGAGEGRSSTSGQRQAAGHSGRRVRFTVSTLEALMALVASTDMIASVLPPVARYCEKNAQLQRHEMPSGDAPCQLYLVWHDSEQTDAGHAWLRELVYRTVCEL
jgi:DNA-binding transcriptional LysR family regulator